MSLKNTITPRVFIAATRQNNGKTTTSLGLLAALQQIYPRIGFMKPIGQRFVRIESHKIDEDTVLMDKVYGLNCPLDEMSPIAVEHDFTRRYLRKSNYEALVERIQRAFDRVAWERDFVLCEGTGHAGVGSVFDLSNARIARLLHAKVIIITEGGIGRPIDEVSLNQALFEKEGVEVIGVILNKTLPSKQGYIAEFVRKGLKRKGLELLGVIPHQRILSCPTMDLIADELGAALLNNPLHRRNIVDTVVVGAMTPQHARRFFKPGSLLIMPGDREDLIHSVSAPTSTGIPTKLAGIILTDNLRPAPNMEKRIRQMPYPVLTTPADSYQIASRVHDLTVKTRPVDTAKITLIRDLIKSYVDVERILEILKPRAARAVP